MITQQKREETLFEKWSGRGVLVLELDIREEGDIMNSLIILQCIMQKEEVTDIFQTIMIFQADIFYLNKFNQQGSIYLDIP